jgi:hypothetical protein
MNNRNSAFPWRTALATKMNIYNLSEKFEQPKRFHLTIFGINLLCVGLYVQ